MWNIYDWLKFLLMIGGVFIIPVLSGYLISRYTKYNFWLFGKRGARKIESKRSVYPNNWLQRHVERKARGVVLDVGTGSGIQAIAAALKPEVTRVVAVDENSKALEEARENATSAGVWKKIEFRQGDLFESVGDEKFDYILFHPPYFPTIDFTSGEAIKIMDIELYVLAWLRRTEERSRRFLIKARDHLKLGGEILLILSIIEGLFPGEDENILEWLSRGYVVEVLEEEKLEPQSERRLHPPLPGGLHVRRPLSSERLLCLSLRARRNA